MPCLQIAVDCTPFDSVLAIAEAVHDVVDIFEVGTPVIMHDGLHAVRRIKERYPQMTVLADTKIVDGGDVECADACAAGADIVTVLGVAADETIRGVIHTAHHYGRKAMADLICIREPTSRAKDLLAMGADYVCIHTAVDRQRIGASPLDAFQALACELPSEKVAVAGGVNFANLAKYVESAPAIVVMGNALCGVADIRGAALRARGLMVKREEG